MLKLVADLKVVFFQTKLLVRVVPSLPKKPRPQIYVFTSFPAFVVFNGGLPIRFANWAVTGAIILL